MPLAATAQDGIPAPGAVSACPREARGHISSPAITLYVAPAQLMSQPGPTTALPSHPGHPCWPGPKPLLLAEVPAWPWPRLLLVSKEVPEA